MEGALLYRTRQRYFWQEQRIEHYRTVRAESE
jgi:hypothetical protein